MHVMSTEMILQYAIDRADRLRHRRHVDTDARRSRTYRPAPPRQR